jgi:LysM repeat protein
MRQQELVCLRAAHSSCPRYLRGTAPEPEAIVAPPRRREIPRATIAALLILLASASAAFTFVLARGGIALPVAGVSPSPAGAAVSSPAPSAADESASTLMPSSGPTAEPSGAAPSTGPTAEPSGAATPTTAPSLSITPAPSLSPVPTTEPSPGPSSASPGRTSSPPPTIGPAGTPSSGRLALLVPCPDRPDCYVYTVRSGDNVRSIANYFGVPYALVLTLNPSIADPALIRAGDRIILPTPTR